jgi:hypothetical protein
VPFEILEAIDLGNAVRCDDQRLQRQPTSRAEPPDVGTSIEGLENVIEGRGRIIERPSDQGLRRGGAAPHVDELHVEAFIPEMAAGACDLIWRGAQNIAAESELNRGPFGRRLLASACQQGSCAREERCTL